jgi:hypothetical protein
MVKMAVAAAAPAASGSPRLIRAEVEHGQMLARSRGSVSCRKGHVVRILPSDEGNGRIRVDANAETVSDDSLLPTSAERHPLQQRLEPRV